MPGLVQGAGGQSPVSGAGERVGMGWQRRSAAEPLRELGGRRPVPVLAAGSLELTEPLTQAGTVPVAGPQQHQDHHQQEAEGQPCGQGAGCCGVKAALKVDRAKNPIPRKGWRAGWR